MSLISDPDYLIHSLRLNYLRNVDDPYGPRLISLDPSYDANPYIYASGLSDVEKWPELAMPSSPPPSDDEGDPGRPGRRRFGATGLKYTTTIMGPSRVGAMGLRVNGKRASAAGKSSYRFSIKSATEVGPSVPVGEKTAMEAAQEASAASPTKREAADTALNGANGANGGAGTSIAASEATAVAEEHKELPKEPPKTISPEFHPRFKGAAEMEARRRERMQARAQPLAAVRPPPPPQYINPELSSSSESESEEEVDEDMPEDEDEDDFDMVPEADDDMDGDEFDPDFAASRGLSGDLDIHTDSDGVSIMSGTNSVMSTSEASSMVGSSLPQGSSSRVRSRLSPVREGRHSEETSVEALPERPEESAPIELGFDMVIPAPKADKAKAPDLLAPTAKRVIAGASSGSASVSADNPFARRPVAPARPGKSALSAMLADTGGVTSTNPFTELYSAIAARADADCMLVNVYFPHAREPAGKPLELKVRKDASVEEVLGFALWSYWEEGWSPKIDQGLQGEEDPKWESRCSAVGWILRIAEDDGEVDEDFPPPDRTGRISKFNFDAYAVLEATPPQVQQNRVLESKIQRRASRIVIKKKKSTGLLNNISAQNALAPPADSFLGTSAGLSSLASSLGMFPSSLGPSTSHGPPQFLRIRIADTADAGHISTTIQASGGMYMAEVLEAVCQKRKLSNPKDYALVLDHGPMKVYVPLDRTVKSLQGKRDLILMKRSMLQNYGVEMSASSGRTTDPNASILKRQSEVVDTPFNLFDPTNAYKKYTVYRKVPMLVTRSARLLAIDGGYIHIMPISHRAKHVFESAKTSSYHLKSVVTCQQSSKNSSIFKLIVRGNAERNKRYDFEAESPKLAAEIAQTIRQLKTAMDRPGTIKQSRRSRHVG